MFNNESHLYMQFFLWFFLANDNDNFNLTDIFCFFYIKFDKISMTIFNRMVDWEISFNTKVARYAPAQKDFLRSNKL